MNIQYIHLVHFKIDILYDIYNKQTSKYQTNVRKIDSESLITSCRGYFNCVLLDLGENWSVWTSRRPGESWSKGKCSAECPQYTFHASRAEFYLFKFFHQTISHHQGPKGSKGQAGDRGDTGIRGDPVSPMEYLLKTGFWNHFDLNLQSEIRKHNMLWYFTKIKINIIL